MTHLEHSTETHGKCINRLENQISSLKKCTKIVIRCKDALFELAPGIFKKYNERARHSTEHNTRLTSLETVLRISQNPPAPTETESSEEIEELITDDSDEFEVIEPDYMLP